MRKKNHTGSDSEEKIFSVRPNKTKLKKEFDALQKMGEDLIRLNSSDFNDIHLPEALESAVNEARKIKSRSGLKRQHQYIGKVMRSLDHEDIATQLAKIQHRHDTNTASFKKVEHWRDRLLNDGHDAVTEVINIYPNIDRQHINQLVRQALQEKQREKPPIAARKLFRYLQEIEESQTQVNI